MTGRRTAFVTGAAYGIGAASAVALANDGCDVAVSELKVDDLTDTLQAITKAGARAVPVMLDVRSLASIERAMAEVLAAFGHLDVLVNNAGIGTFKALVDTDRDSFGAVFATNVTGAMLMAREAAKHFITRNQGNIVNICSTASLRGAPRGTTYYGSKFALRGMTECWRAELRQHNVRVFLINPSEVLTPFGAAAGHPQKPNPTKLRGEEIAHAVKAVLEMDDRGFTPELSVFATNPKD